MHDMEVVAPTARLAEALDRPARAAVRLSGTHPAVAVLTALAAAAALALPIAVFANPVGWRALLEAVALSGATLVVACTWLRLGIAPGVLLGAAAVGLQTAAVVVACFLPLVGFVVFAGGLAPPPPLVSTLLGLMALGSYAVVVSRVVRTVAPGRTAEVLAGLHSGVLLVVFAVRDLALVTGAWP